MARFQNLSSPARTFALLAAITLLATVATPAWAIPGFNVIIQDNFGEGGIGGTVDNINEGETLLALGGAPEATATPLTLNYVGTGGAGNIGGDIAFPGGFNGTDDWALSATGYVTGIGGEGTGVFRMGVNSDDGFRVRRNGTVIGEFVAPKGPGDVLFEATLSNGDKLELNFFERSGGEEIEFFRLNSLINSKDLINTGPSGIFIDTAPTPIQTSLNTNHGFNVIVQNASATPGVVGATVDNVNEAELLLLGGGTPEGTANFFTISTPITGFPAGTAADDFAFQATGFIDVLDPSGTADIAFIVNSDDGFRLRLNGVVISEFVGTTGNSNTLSALVTVKDNDFLDLVYFERAGGNFVSLQADFDGLLSTALDRAIIGLSESGILISRSALVTVPEPATMSLLAIGSLALLRRRRAA